MSEQFEHASHRRLRWLAAFLLGLMLHAGAIYAALERPRVEEQDDDMAGPIAIELAAIAVAPPSEKLDLPIGPRADESQASAPTPTKAEVAKAEDAPNLTTTPYEPDDPDLRFSKHSIEKKADDTPVGDKTTEAVESPPVSSSTPVTETTAPPPSDAPPAPSLAAPQAGLSEADRKALERWQRKVVLHLAKFKRYPAGARSARIEGDVTVTFTINRFGQVTTRAVGSGSGSDVLDAAALAILDSAGSLPPPPGNIPGDAFDLSLPVEYRVKG